jgi:ankyrin repeat protein
MKNGQAFILVYHIAHKDTFRDLQDLYQLVLRVKDVTNLPCIVIGSSSHSSKERQVSIKEAALFANDLDFPFHETSARCHVNTQKAFEEVIRLFCKMKKEDDNMNNPKKRRLVAAILNGNQKELLEYRPKDINSEIRFGETALMISAKVGELSIAKALLELGCDINTPSINYGESALFIACSYGHLEFVRFLLENRAFIESENLYHETPIFAAALNFHFDIVRLLVQHGANTSKINKNGFSVLAEMIQYGDLECVKLLIEIGCSVQWRSETGNTLAFTLIQCRYRWSLDDIIQLLHILHKLGVPVNESYLIGETLPPFTPFDIAIISELQKIEKNKIIE